MGILSFFRRSKADRRRGGGRGAAQEPAAPKTSPPPEKQPAVAASPAAGRRPGRVSDSLAVFAPRVTEKATLQQTHGTYTFRVSPSATKQDVRRTVEQRFGVHVAGVRVVNVRGKTRRRGRVEGKTAGHKKALVTLRQGERIDLAGGTT